MPAKSAVCSVNSVHLSVREVQDGISAYIATSQANPVHQKRVHHKLLIQSLNQTFWQVVRFVLLTVSKLRTSLAKEFRLEFPAANEENPIEKHICQLT